MTQSSLWQPSDIMNAETAGETETPKRRGRIPQSAWPHILERHRAGVTLSAIAREFDCTPSAISYIVRKAEASGIEPALAPEAKSPEAKSPEAETAESSETVTDGEVDPEQPVAQQQQPEAAASPAGSATEGG